MTPWYEVRVASHHEAAEGLTALALDVAGTPLVGRHVLPGQYVRLELPGRGDGLFALASRPDEHGHTFELLLKRGGELSDALGALPLGSLVRVGPPEGKGFPLEAAAGSPLWLFATGSGISAIRSVVQVLVTRRARFGEVTLYFGARTPAGFAYENELSDWATDGIRVVRTVSQPGDSGWVGLTGYVQQHLPAHAPEGVWSFLCGRREMVSGVTQALAQRGVAKERILLNY